MRRSLFAALALSVFLAACSSPMSLDDYAETLEEIVATMQNRIDALDVIVEGNNSIEAIRSYARDRIDARTTMLDGFRALDPPDEAADLHAVAVDILARLTAAESAMADLAFAADNVDDLGDLWNSPEGQAARAIDVEALAVCQAAQESFDSTQGREGFQGQLWVPRRLQVVVDVTFSCGGHDT